MNTTDIIITVPYPSYKEVVVIHAETQITGEKIIYLNKNSSLADN